MNNGEVDRLCSELLDQTISAEDFDRLQCMLAEDPTARRVYLSYVRLHEGLQEIALSPSVSSAVQSSDGVPSPDLIDASKGRGSALPRWRGAAALLAVAASLTSVVVGWWYWLPRPRPTSGAQSVAMLASPDGGERLLAGHATLRHAVGVRWDAQTPA
ncbi:MAG: hypothetical protein D6753_02205, partial [Planctomycetota bacterium]